MSLRTNHMELDWQEKFLSVSWKDFVSQAFILNQKIAANAHHYDLIVAIARGGLTLAQLLSDFLSLPIASFTVQSYKDIKQEKLPHITFELGGFLHHKKVLLVDDVSDTGKTFLRGISYLEELGAEKSTITTVSLHFKPHSSYKPDFYAAQTDKWVIYPYEVRETIESLSSVWKKDGKNQEEIKDRLSALGFANREIEKFVSL